MFRGIDLSSDTLTKPTSAMKQAMLNAPLGDEQRGEDPTTRLLEDEVAALLGLETALFLPSATMANSIAVHLLCEPGEEVIAAHNSHLFNAEAGGVAVLSGAMAKPVYAPEGIFSGAEVRAAHRWAHGPLYPRTALVSIENTVNAGGGTFWSPSQLESVRTACQELGLLMHLDGSRIWNAAAASGMSLSDIAFSFQTITVCFSKGLGCPFGALLACSKALWPKARQMKQRLGGAMRQSGMLAAAALYAVKEHRARLQEDHERARQLACFLAEMPHVAVENNPPATNMVFFRWKHPAVRPAELLLRCVERGLRFGQTHEDRFRMVLHLDIDDTGLRKAMEIFQQVVKSCGYSASRLD